MLFCQQHWQHESLRMGAITLKARTLCQTLIIEPSNVSSSPRRGKEASVYPSSFFLPSLPAPSLFWFSGMSFIKQGQGPVQKPRGLKRHAECQTQRHCQDGDRQRACSVMLLSGLKGQKNSCWCRWKFCFIAHSFTGYLQQPHEILMISNTIFLVCCQVLAMHLWLAACFKPLEAELYSVWCFSVPFSWTCGTAPLLVFTCQQCQLFRLFSIIFWLLSCSDFICLLWSWDLDRFRKLLYVLMQIHEELSPWNVVLCPSFPVLLCPFLPWWINECIKADLFHPCLSYLS